MKRESYNILAIENSQYKTKVSFRNIDRLTILDSEAIRLELIDLAVKKDTLLEIDLLGIRFIDSSIIDIFNLLSRMAHRYNSRVKLSNVSAELFELIELVKLHSVFDIKQIGKAHQNNAA